MRCIGIDLAWSPRNSSGGFALEIEDGTARELGWREDLGSDDEVVAFIAATAAQGAALVAIDAPIAVPNESGARPCDRAITRVFGRFQAGAHPASRQTLGRYGGLRGERLARRIERELEFAHDPYVARRAAVRQLMEVYPHPGMVALFGLERTLKYKRGAAAQRRVELGRLQEHLLALADGMPALQAGEGWRRDIAQLGGRRLKQYEDLLDSLFCAYSAVFCWHHGPTHYEVFGSIQEGHILVPIPPDQRPRLGLPPMMA
jgi:predicted RNase H-like nuclease